MISIHLRRTGAKRDAHYRVVVSDRSAARDGAFIEILGHYHPRYQPAKVILDVERVKEWIAKGAQPTDTVSSLLRQVQAGKVDVTDKPVKMPPKPEGKPKPEQALPDAEEPVAEVAKTDTSAAEDSAEEAGLDDVAEAAAEEETAEARAEDEAAEPPAEEEAAEAPAEDEAAEARAEEEAAEAPAEDETAAAEAEGTEQAAESSEGEPTDEDADRPAESS